MTCLLGDDIQSSLPSLLAVSASPATAPAHFNQDGLEQRTSQAIGQSRSGDEGPAATGPHGGSAGGDCNALLRAAGRCRTVIPEAKLP